MDVGEATKLRILQLCHEYDMSVNKLSNTSGITQSTMNNIVSGRNKTTTVTTIKKLCDGLGISLVDFFNDDIFRNLEQEVK